MSPNFAAPLTLADLRRALDDKEHELRALLERKERIAAELEELGATLEAMLLGGSVASGRAPARGSATKATRGGAKTRAPKGDAGETGAKAAPREGSLPAFIRAVLERVVGPMKVGEIVEAVTAAGYESKSKNLGIIVSNRLAQMEDVERVDRGLFQLKRDGLAAAATAAPSAN